MSPEFPWCRFTNDSLVPLRISARDMAARKKAKDAGGRWNPEKQLWFVSYCNVVGTVLEKYIDIDGLDKAKSHFYINAYSTLPYRYRYFNMHLDGSIYMYMAH